METKLTKSVDEKKRQALLQATSVLSLLGVAGAAIPFISSMLPSAAAVDAGRPIRVDLSSMQPGEQKTVIWRGQPVWIIYRTAADIKRLADLGYKNILLDPNSKMPQQPSYAKNNYRSRKPEFFICFGVCTHLGCTPTYRPEVASINQDWPGGFFCSCHGSKFDLSGHVFRGMPAPSNLEVPPYKFVADNIVLIGLD